LADAEPAVTEPVINRVALHAFSLEFMHPSKNEMMKFEAPLPQDMQNFLNELRKYRTI
jgi:23S rRNA pseudouridine1911/1915/1917 synthase